MLSQPEFHQRIARTTGPALVVFTSEGCAACARLKSVLWQAPPDLTLFEVDAHHAQGVAAEHDVFHLPAMFLYVDGSYHAPIHAELNGTAILDAIAQARRSPAQEPP